MMDRLNDGLLPPDYFAMAEQIIGRPETDVIALHSGKRTRLPTNSGPGVTAVTGGQPQTRIVSPVAPDQERYARMANRIAIHHELGKVVAVIEIVSLGKQGSQTISQDVRGKGD